LVDAKDPYLIIVYLCETKTEVVNLSHEHQAYLWANEDECRKLLPKPIIEDFDKNRIFNLLESKNQV
jgi:8-oxo-dGTP diphosphatase